MEQIKSVMDLINFLEDIRYGWMDIEQNIYIDTEKGFKKKICFI